MTSHRSPIRSALILGSTSTVARALADQLARRGCRRLLLFARDAQANAALADQLHSRYGVDASCHPLDLAASARTGQVQLPPGDVDLVLLAAGSLGNTTQALDSPAESLQITVANYTGLLPWLVALTTPDRIRRPGRLWVFSSVAADRGRPSNYPYGAAKAALTTFCEGLLLRCHGKPFAVRIIKAGFMATPMTVGKAPPLLCVSPETVARDLLRRPDRRGIEYLPWWWSPLMLLIRLLPAPLASRL